MVCKYFPWFHRLLFHPVDGFLCWADAFWFDIVLLVYFCELCIKYSSGIFPLKKSDRERLIHIFVHCFHSSLMVQVSLSPCCSEGRESGRLCNTWLGHTSKQWSSRGMDPGWSASRACYATSWKSSSLTAWALIYLWWPFLAGTRSVVPWENTCRKLQPVSITGFWGFLLLYEGNLQKVLTGTLLLTGD